MTQPSGLTALQAPWRIGVDVGGTFTDLVLTDSAGETRVIKAPSVPSAPSRGVLSALDRLALALDCGVGDILRNCTLFVHGSTVATNTMLEGKGARVGLLTTEGFRDALEIRRGLREDQWNHRAPYAPVLVPRHLRLGVGGRIDKDGSEHAALVTGDIDAALETFRAEGVEAVAVAFFNSFLDDRHEAAAEAHIRVSWPEVWITRSAARSAARRPAASPSRQNNGSRSRRQSSSICCSVTAVPRGATTAENPSWAMAITSI